MRDLSTSDYAIAALTGVAFSVVLIQPIPFGIVAVSAIVTVTVARFATIRHRQKTER